MDKILLTKEQSKKVDKIFKHELDGRRFYYVYLKNVDECFWCEDLHEVYKVIDEH